MQKGFSLVELLITVVLVSILLSVAIPSFRTTLLGIKGSSLADNLVSSIHYVRSEAITRGRSITLCASLDGANCNNSATNWNQGWIATWENPDLAPPNQTEVLRYWAIEETAAQVNLSVSNTHRVIYKSSGEAILSADGTNEVGPPSGISFQTQVSGCEEQPVLNHRRVVDIAPFGIVTITRGDCQ